MRFSIFALAIAATPLAAQDLASRYTQVGVFEGMLGDTAVRLVATIDLEEDRSSVTIDNRNGFAMILTQTRSVAPDGSLTSPGIGFLIGPKMPASGDNADITIRTESGFYVADPDMGGRIPVTDLEYSETSLSFTIEAMIAPAVRVDWEFKPDPTREPITLTGRFEGTPSWKSE